MGQLFKDKRFWFLAVLALLVGTTITVGLFFKHYFSVCVFGVWVCVEVLLWRWRYSTGPRALKNFLSPAEDPYASLISLYAAETSQGDDQLLLAIDEWRSRPSGLSLDVRVLDGLVDLVSLRQLLKPVGGRGKRAMREAFVISQWGRRAVDKASNVQPERLSFLDLTTSDVMDAAMFVSDRLWRVWQFASVPDGTLTDAARDLYRRMFGSEFEIDRSRAKIEQLSDQMQRNGGLPFLVLNLLKKGQVAAARQVAQSFLQSEEPIDEELRSTLYWIAEVFWFANEQDGWITDAETALRYIYHLCFTNADRAGFLEIDSQFFSQFEAVNQLAQEGFVFKEHLVDRTLEMWNEYGEIFNPIFQCMMENMTQQRSKIYDDYATWDRFWKREREAFCKEYLFVVEGNLCYAAKQYDDAKTYYEKALKANPELRSAQLNLVFCYARLGLSEQHESLVSRLVEDKRMLPAALYVVANSYILLGKDGHADVYYSELAQTEDWRKKVDYYRSTFCFEQGLFEKALEYAKEAHAKNPQDPSIRYHLSLCFNSTGHKEDALKLLDGMMESPQWMNYYRFTLERDSGRHQQASETLLGIPTEYFEDPDELEAALTFARNRRDLVLLRHLRQK